MFKGIAFLILRLLLKRIDLVLSSPKWILNLLSTNQSHIKLKFLLSWISISLQIAAYHLYKAERGEDLV